jgi:hypothetical protein
VPVKMADQAVVQTKALVMDWLLQAVKEMMAVMALLVVLLVVVVAEALVLLVKMLQVTEVVVALGQHHLYPVHLLVVAEAEAVELS